MVVPVEGVVLGESGVIPVFACCDDVRVVWLVKVGHASVRKVTSMLVIVYELLSKVNCWTALVSSYRDALYSSNCCCQSQVLLNRRFDHLKNFCECFNSLRFDSLKYRGRSELHGNSALKFICFKLNPHTLHKF